MLKEYMIKTLHRLYREDSWVRELYDASGIKLEEAGKYIEEVFDNNFFDSASEDGLKAFEKEAGLKPDDSASVESRIGSLRAKWVGSGNATLEMLQRVADSWKNGLMELAFVDGKIKVEFTSPVGQPSDIEALQEALEKVKPAHLAIYFIFRFRFWREVKAGTLNPYGNTWADWKRKAVTWQGVLKEGNQ